MSDDAVNTVPATPGQRLIWLMNRFRGGNGMMAVPMLFRIQGGLVVSDLEGALDDVVARHAILRTTFAWQDRGLRQTVHPQGWSGLTLTRLDTATEPDPEKAAYRQVRDYLRADLDVSATPVRAALWHIADDDHLFIFDTHHIGTDAWSNMIISRDLAALYRARRQGRTAGLPDIPWQYPDYSAWLQEHLKGEVVDRHRDYLLGALKGVQFPRLPPLPEQARGRVPESANAWFDLGSEQVSALREVARAERTTLFVVLLSLFFVAMQQVTGQPDIAMGSIFANRSRREVQETAGFFANMVVVRTRLGPRPAIREMIRAVRRSVLEGLAHEEFSYLSLLHDSWQDGASGLPRDVVFHMLAEPPTARGEERLDFGGPRVQPHHIPDGLACRFELEMLIIPSRPGALEGVIRYAADRFTPEYAQDLIRRYRAALTELVGDLPAGATPLVASGPGMTTID